METSGAYSGWQDHGEEESPSNGLEIVNNGRFRTSEPPRRLHCEPVLLSPQGYHLQSGSPGGRLQWKLSLFVPGGGLVSTPDFGLLLLVFVRLSAD